MYIRHTPDFQQLVLYITIPPVYGQLKIDKIIIASRGHYQLVCENIVNYAFVTILISLKDHDEDIIDD